MSHAPLHFIDQMGQLQNSKQIVFIKFGFLLMMEEMFDMEFVVDIGSMRKITL